MVSGAQIGQHGQHAIKQADVVLVLQIMKAVTLAQRGVFVLGHIGRGVSQSGHQGHADDKGRCLVAGFDATHIDHRRLDAAGDDGGRVKQGAVPIEGNQIKLAGALAHGGLSEIG
jgi:hypothetical protein